MDNYTRTVEKLVDDIMSKKPSRRAELTHMIFLHLDTFLETYFKEMAHMQKKLEYLNSLHKEDEMDEVIHEILEEQEYEDLHSH